jgi:hypothetical protein
MNVMRITDQTPAEIIANRLAKFTKPRGELTQARLMELLNYAPETGLFTWLKNRGPNAQAGRVAGCQDAEGYVLIRVDLVIYKAHRLAHFYVTGAWPDGQMDHRNGVTSDNRWDNLRVVDAKGNAQNRRLYSNNKAGMTGVCYLKRCDKWQAQISGQYLGRFRTAQEASEAYLSAKEKLHTTQPVPRR